MKKQLVLLIEGTSDDTNGDLKIGFGSLLEQKLRGKMPRIRMGNGKSETYRKFKKPLPNEMPFLLVDLDGPEDKREQEVREQGLENNSKNIFFMIQEMEAWILSQPEILDEYYQEKISVKIKRNPSEIPNPDEFLQNLTKNTKKGEYHKVRNGVELLQRLNLQRLEISFSDVKQLIQTLNSL